MSKQRKKILFITYIPSQLNEVLRIVKILDDKVCGNILYIEDYSLIDLESYQKKIKSSNWRLSSFCSKKTILQPKFDKACSNLFCNFFYLRVYLKIVLFYFRFESLFFEHPFVQRINFYFRIKKLYNFAKSEIRKHKPDVVIVNEENIFYLTNVFTKLARDYLIPSLIIPYAICESEGFIELAKKNQVNGMKKKFIGHLFPEWIKKYKGKYISLLSFSQILILKFFKISPPKPWLINSGFTRAIAVESKAMLNHYFKGKLPSQELVITGSVSDDILFKKNENKKKFYKRYNLQNKPTIVCALPSHMDARMNHEFKEYKELINFLIICLNQKTTRYNILFSLHPHISYKEKLEMEKLGAKIIEEDIGEAISFCDLFIASISSTIRWAIAAGIPVINYDVYRLHYHDYDSAKGVITIEKKEDFEKVLEKITTDKKYYQKIKEKQEKSAPDWGIIDGESGKRILNLIDQLIRED